MSAPLAVILAGGLGTRIRHLLPDSPKPLAKIAGRPFLEWIIRYLWRQGFRRMILSTGYQASKVEAFASTLSIADLEISCVEETSPLGTAGGFLNAIHGVKTSANVLVCNGDSLVLTALSPLIRALDATNIEGALLAVEVSDAKHFGSVAVDNNGLLCGFSEKRAGTGMINGGVYLFRWTCVDRFPSQRPLSFEYEVFPALLEASVHIKVVPCNAPFLDIGNDASLAQATDFIRLNRGWFE